MTDRLASAAVLLLASGSGTRMGGTTPKQLYKLGGKTLVQRAVETYAGVELIVVTYHPDHKTAIRNAVDAAAPRAAVVMVPGGPSRRASITNALTELHRPRWTNQDLVVIHNAASPNTPTELVERCLAAAGKTGASQAYIPCHHTVVRLVGDTIDNVVSRDKLGHTADPTVYRIGVLRAALAAGTGTAGETTLDLVRQQNVVVTAVVSPWTNIKVTVPIDLAILAQRDRQRVAGLERPSGTDQ